MSHLYSKKRIQFPSFSRKRDDRDESVNPMATGHPVFCPVKVGAAIIQHMQAMDADDDTFLHTYVRDRDGKRGELTSGEALVMLRNFVRTIDFEALGLHPDDVGLHSLRASAAMVMYLNGVPVYTIMLLGRWSSDAFLRYIRKQIEEFGHDVSRKMIQNPRFHHIPDPDRNDPRSRRNPFSFTANMGMGSGGVINLSAFSVWQ